MPRETLLRLGFTAAVLGGVLFVVSNLFLIGADYDNFAETIPTASFTVHTVLFWVAAAFFLLGLVALYVIQAERAGKLGLIGFVLAFFGTAFALGTTWSETFALAVLAEEAPALVDDPPARVSAGLSIAFPLFVIGWLLFAVATVRARVLPRGAAIGLIIGVVAALAAFGLPGIGAIFGAAVAWLGYSALTLAAAPDEAATT